MASLNIFRFPSTGIRYVGVLAFLAFIFLWTGYVLVMSGGFDRLMEGTKPLGWLIFVGTPIVMYVAIATAQIAAGWLTSKLLK